MDEHFLQKKTHHTYPHRGDEYFKFLGFRRRLSKCGWLLRMRDLIQSDEMKLTQDFMAQMLNVRRTGVSLIAGTLQSAGLISYRRGNIKITDVEALRPSACESRDARTTPQVAVRLGLFAYRAPAPRLSLSTALEERMVELAVVPQCNILGCPSGRAPTPEASQ